MSKSSHLAVSVTAVSLTVSAPIKIFEPGFQERNWQYPPVAGEAGYLGSAATYRLSENYPYFDPFENDKDDRWPFR
jgi:hypothetical protein